MSLYLPLLDALLGYNNYRYAPDVSTISLWLPLFSIHLIHAILCYVIQEVATLDFHPYQAILASGSLDRTIKLFDYSRSSTKKAQKAIQVWSQINHCRLEFICDGIFLQRFANVRNRKKFQWLYGDYNHDEFSQKIFYQSFLAFLQIFFSTK